MLVKVDKERFILNMLRLNSLDGGVVRHHGNPTYYINTFDEVVGLSTGGMYFISKVSFPIARVLEIKEDHNVK